MAKNTALKKNRNIVLIKDTAELTDEVDYSNFAYQNYFSLLCKLLPNKKDEKLTIEIVDEQQFKREGLVYVFVIEGKIFKIGQSITDIKRRINSYNCGKLNYRIHGTNSTTNYFVLQSILAMECIVEVYAYFADKQEYIIFGEAGEDCFPSTKVIERKILKEFIERHGKKPIANTQR